MDVSSKTHGIARLLDWTFRDRSSGKIVIVQFPNTALWIYLATVALRWVVPTGTSARAVADWIGVASLAWWALDEVFRGVNPWRRFLGIAGCAAVVSGAVSLLR